jgi:2-polyprenyl-3-methyl-5-hydroxy-6-metoxy-1,4-benzoquinol methylase
MNMDLSHSYAITESANEGHIRTVAQPQCILCECKGQLIYSGQKDCLFGADGSWDFKICPNRECGLIWLDPMPLKEDIGKAYANYYTHSKLDQTEQVGLLKQIYRLMKRGYLAAKYNYQIGSGSFIIKSIGKLLYLFPIRRNGTDEDVRFLHAVPQGRLLDVGCGSGEWLISMRKRGWRVEGVDFDENAIKVARQMGLEICRGSLEQQNFPANSFDAVTLNHVIEHVPDPIQTLAECGRILKPGGKLVLCTPNSLSLGHKIFKQHWRGLEPPRHLHIFSTQAIVRLLELSGFKHISVKPQVSFFVIYKSLLLQWEETNLFKILRLNYFIWSIAQLINGIEFCLTKWNPSFAECMAAIAVKE